MASCHLNTFYALVDDLQYLSVAEKECMRQCVAVYAPYMSRETFAKMSVLLDRNTYPGQTCWVFHHVLQDVLRTCNVQRFGVLLLLNAKLYVESLAPTLTDLQRSVIDQKFIEAYLHYLSCYNANAAGCNVLQHQARPCVMTKEVVTPLSVRDGDHFMSLQPEGLLLRLREGTLLAPSYAWQSATNTLLEKEHSNITYHFQDLVRLLETPHPDLSPYFVILLRIKFDKELKMLQYAENVLQAEPVDWAHYLEQLERTLLEQ